MIVTFTTVPTFNAFDSQCRRTWAEGKNKPMSTSYRFWGDEALVADWLYFLADLVRRDVALPDQVIRCLELMDAGHVLRGKDPVSPWLPDLRPEARLVREPVAA